MTRGDRNTSPVPAAALLALSVAVCLHAGAGVALAAGVAEPVGPQPVPPRAQTLEGRATVVRDDHEAVASLLAKLHDVIDQLTRVLQSQSICPIPTRPSVDVTADLISTPVSPQAAAPPQPLRPALLNLPPPLA